MPKKQKQPSNLPDMNKWVNDALTFIEGPQAIIKPKQSKPKTEKLKPADDKKAAKKAKQKLKKEERKLLEELNELREQFHSLYFKEYDAKNELKELKSNKKQDKKKVLAIENNIKKLKKTKSNIESNILALIGSLKTINQAFKFSYLPSKEELQKYIQKCAEEAEAKLKPTLKCPTAVQQSYQQANPLIPIQTPVSQLVPNNIASHLSNSGMPFGGPFGSPAINPNLFAPPGFTPMFPNSSNFFSGPVYSNPVVDKEIENKDLSERIVTIRRVYLPDNEAQVTVTAKGNSPDQDKLLYTFVNGQLVPANKVNDPRKEPTKNKNKKNKNKNQLKDTDIQQQQSLKQKDNKQMLTTATKASKKKHEQELTQNSIDLKNKNKKKTETRQCPVVAANNPPVENSQFPTKSSKKNDKINKNTSDKKSNATDYLRSKLASHKESVSSEENLKAVSKEPKKKKSKKKKSIDVDSESVSENLNSNHKSNKYKPTDPIHLNLGETDDVLTLVKLNGNNDISTYKSKKQSRKIQQQQFYKQNNFPTQQSTCCDVQNSDCNTKPLTYNFNNNLDDLYPQMKNLSINPTTVNDSSSTSYLHPNKSDSPSIMEQLKQGVNVENLKLPPGISLTKVDPATSQALRAKQNSIQKLSQPISGNLGTAGMSTSNVSNYNPIYPNIEITPHFMHDPSGLIMIDSNRNNNLYQQQQYTQFNGMHNAPTIPSVYQKPPGFQTLATNNKTQTQQDLSQNQTGTTKKKRNKKNKNKQNISENQVSEDKQTNSSKIITLKNPMFNNMPPPIKAPPGFLQHTTSPPINDQPAIITKNENGMFTIRNTALQENFLARCPYAGPGGILIPSNPPPGILPPPPGYNLSSLSAKKNCDGDSHKSNFSFPHGIPFQESMKDHICEPNGY